jgi:penicillin amidase
VPGTGKYEWQGFRRDLPRELNPERGFIATANHNVQPKGYSPPFMFKTPELGIERIGRLRQVLTPPRAFTIEDHRKLQTDALSLRAAGDLKQFTGWTSSNPDAERARATLAAWDGVLSRDSAAAAIYDAMRAPGGGRGNAEAEPVGDQPAAGDRASVETRLVAAVKRLSQSQGADQSKWRWGRSHTRPYPHPFVPAFDLPTVERPGGAGTVAADGASYREILDVADWDRSIATNTPGQSGQPGSRFYGNLLPLWADDQYFPLAFSKQAVEKHAATRLTLRSGGGATSSR